MGLFDKKFDLKLGSLFLKDSAAFTNMMLNGLPAQLNVPVSAPQLNFDSTEFDPNAGRLEAYNKRWNAYLNTLAKDNNKINVKKARKYFDSQFELDWENEYADRFSSAIDNSMERLKAQSMDLVSKNYEDNGYTFDGANWILPEESTTPLQSTPQQPALAPSGHSMYWWLQQAQKYNPNFKSIEDVTNWQKENGLVADGKFGKNSLAKWNELQNNSPVSNINVSDYDAAFDSADAQGINYKDALTGRRSEFPESVNNQSQSIQQPLIPFNGDDSYFYRSNLINAIKTLYLNYINNNTNPEIGYGNLNNIKYDKYWNSDEYKNYEQLILSQYLDHENDPWALGYNLWGLRYTRKDLKGGIINKFEKGGKKMGRINFDPELMKMISGIYGNTDLDGKVLKLLYKTWLSNPDFIRNTYNLKQEEARRQNQVGSKLIARPQNSVAGLAKMPETPSHIDAVENPNPYVNFKGVSFDRAFSAADKAGLKTFKWNDGDYTTEHDENWKMRWPKYRVKPNRLSLADLAEKPEPLKMSTLNIKPDPQAPVAPNRPNLANLAEKPSMTITRDFKNPFRGDAMSPVPARSRLYIPEPYMDGPIDFVHPEIVKDALERRKGVSDFERAHGFSPLS